MFQFTRLPIALAIISALSLNTIAQNASSSPDSSMALSFPAQCAFGTAEGILTINSEGTNYTLSGKASSGETYAENWNLNAAVLDYYLETPVELPASSDALAFQYRRLNAKNVPPSETYLRALITDRRGGMWALGTRLGAKRSQLENPQNFTDIQSYPFDTTEAGRLDPWVLMSLNGEQFDTYDAPQPPLSFAGFRVICTNPSGNPFEIEIRNVEPLNKEQRQSPYWALVPHRQMAVRQGRLYTNYEGNYGWGKNNAIPYLTGNSLGLSSGQYTVSWEILDSLGDKQIASGYNDINIKKADSPILELPLLSAGSYRLRVAVKVNASFEEFYFSYVVIRNASDAHAEDLPLAKPLILKTKGGPVYSSTIGPTISVTKIENLQDATTLEWTLETQDGEVIEQVTSKIDDTTSLDLSPWATPGDVIWVTAKLKRGEEIIDISRRLVGFPSKSRIHTIKSTECSNKLEQAIDGQIYRMKGDWVEGATPVASQSKETQELLVGWLDEAKDTGYNLVELSAPWDDLNPLPGVYLFQYLDPLVEAARERGLYVTFRLHPNVKQTPAWVKREFMEDEDGFAHGLWSGGNNLIYSPSAQQFKEGFIAYSEALASYFRDNPYVVGYCQESLFYDHDMIDMPWLGQNIEYSETAQDAYLQFLKERYGDSLKKLNTTYNTDYSSWASIPMPHPEIRYDEQGRIQPRTAPPWVDWSDFKKHAIHSFRIEALDALKRGDPNCWIGLYNTASVPFYAKDIADRDSWITYGSMEAQHVPVAPSIRGRYEPHGKIARTKSLVDVGMSNILLSGPPGYSGFFNYWFLNKRLDTVTADEKEAEERLKVWFAVMDTVLGAEFVQEDSESTPGGFLVVPETQLTLLQHLFTGRTEDYLKPWIYRMGQDGIHAEEIKVTPGETINTSHFPYIYVPFGAADLDTQTISALEQYVKDGGRLFLEATSGYWSGETANALGQAFHLPEATPIAPKGIHEQEAAEWTTHSPLPIAPALNFRTQEYTPPINTQATPWVHNIPRAFLRPYRVKEALPDDAQILAHYEDGSPAAALLHYGKGEVFVFFGVVDWIDSPGLALALDAWGHQATSKTSKDSKLIQRALIKDDTLYIIGRRFMGHDDLESLKSGNPEAVSNSTEQIDVPFPETADQANSYRVQDILSGKDFGSMSTQSLLQEGIHMDLAKGEAFILEATPDK